MGYVYATSGRGGTSAAAEVRGVEDAAARVYGRLQGELDAMAGVLGAAADRTVFNEIGELAGSCLTSIESMVIAGRISPGPVVRLGDDGRVDPAPDRPLRVGFLPTAANPFHWMHLMGGLVAMSRLHLDQVVYINAGEDPRKPDLVPARIRHRMGRQFLDAFAPFFAYSPISLEGRLSGEENLFRLLALNADRAVHAFYLVGSDHYHRWDPRTGLPDTIQRLEDGIAKWTRDPEAPRHQLTVVFMERGDRTEPVPTTLDVGWISDLPLRCSSTSIRQALCGRGSPEVLAALPLSVFRSIDALGLYAPVANARAH